MLFQTDGIGTMMLLLMLAMAFLPLLGGVAGWFIYVVVLLNPADYEYILIILLIWGIVMTVYGVALGVFTFSIGFWTNGLPGLLTVIWAAGVMMGVGGAALALALGCVMVGLGIVKKDALIKKFPSMCISVGKKELCLNKKE